MVSKNRLATLPDIESLRKLSQSLALLDAILSPEWEYRYYSFNSKWKQGEMMASMKDGEGDEYFILFNSYGAIIKGFSHEASMSPYAANPARLWQGLLEEVPKQFQGFLADPAFSIQDTTFCMWRGYSDPTWQMGKINYPEGNDPDGSEDLLSILNGRASTYQAFAEEYYEREVDLGAVEQIYRHAPLSSPIISALNPELSLEDLSNDIQEIGY